VRETKSRGADRYSGDVSGKGNPTCTRTSPPRRNAILQRAAVFACPHREKEFCDYTRNIQDTFQAIPRALNKSSNMVVESAPAPRSPVEFFYNKHAHFVLVGALCGSDRTNPAQRRNSDHQKSASDTTSGHASTNPLAGTVTLASSAEREDTQRRRFKRRARNFPTKENTCDILARSYIILVLYCQ
jgi:hypothetical protein